MLYTLIGNGNANNKEVISSLNSLLDAAMQVLPDEDFWMVFVDTVPMSETYENAVQWALKKGIPFEYVTSDSYTENDEELPEWTRNADYCHFVKHPTMFTVKLTKVRPQPYEERAVLVLSDDLDTDDEVLAAIEKFIDNDVPVYDLGNQMVQITFEEVDEDPVPTPLETPSPEDFHINSEVSVDLSFTREDLTDLSLHELKSMANTLGVTPRDMRSKDSLIESILSNAQELNGLLDSQDAEIAEHIEEVYTPSKFYLVTIDAAGDAEMRPLTAKQAALVL